LIIFTLPSKVFSPL